MPIFSSSVAFLLAAAAGALLVCGFAPFSWWWLTLVCPAALYVALAGRSPGTAFLLGLVFGLVFFGLGISWTFNSIHEYGHAPVWLGVFLVTLLVAVLALFPAVSALLFSKLCSGQALCLRGALAFATFWTISEWVRGWIFTGFPWLLMGHAHHSSPLQGVVPILGSYGASWVAVLTGCLAAVLVFAAVRKKLVSLAVLVLAAVLMLVTRQLAWTTPAGEPLSIALIQGNISQEEKWDRTKHAGILNRYKQLSEANLDAEIIVWPESAIPTYFYKVRDSFIPELEEIAKESGTDFLVGLFTYDQLTGGVYNSLMTFGEERSFYSKRRLVPFGEYIPFRDLAAFLARHIDLPMSDISAGKGRPLVKLKGYQVGASICYEVVYGNEIIEAMPEADFLVNISNDAWFGDSYAPEQHLEISRSRAIESGRYLLRATSTGISAVIDQKGLIVARSSQFQEDVVRAKIRPHQGQTPYSRLGNWTILAILSCISLIILLCHWHRTRPRTLSLNRPDREMRHS